MKIQSSTFIYFSGGTVSGTSKIIFYKEMPQHPSKLLVITESTPFHPLDYNWPDQPGDKGTLTIEGKIIPVDDCLIGAIHSNTFEFLLDQEIKNFKIRRNDPDWFFVVVHMVDTASLGNEILALMGKSVSLEVDKKHRLALSRSHTACHLASLALNKVTTQFWKKSPDVYDSLGNPNFDQTAIVMSKINVENSLDHYRCGKSLKKKGFDNQLFFTDSVFKDVELALNNQLLHWCRDEKGLKISVYPEQTYLHKLREWHCVLPEGKEAVIPCGGTHINAVPPNEKIIVTFNKINEHEFIMTSQWAPL